MENDFKGIVRLEESRLEQLFTDNYIDLTDEEYERLLEEGSIKEGEHRLLFDVNTLYLTLDTFVEDTQELVLKMNSMEEALTTTTNTIMGQYNIISNKMDTTNKLLTEISGKLDYTDVIKTIEVDDWVDLSDKDPFVVSAEVNLNDTSLESIELINDNAELFSKYGFSIVSENEGIVVIYAIDKPDISVDLRFEVK